MMYVCVVCNLVVMGQCNKIIILNVFRLGVKLDSNKFHLFLTLPSVNGAHLPV